MTNQEIILQLRNLARKLESQGDQLFRVRACRAAVLEIARMNEALEVMFARGGRKALEGVPGVGRSLASTIEGILQTGEAESVRREVDPRQEFLTLPGVGHQLAVRLRRELGLDSLAALLEAARSGRLEQLGVTPTRIEGIIRSVEFRLREESNPVSARLEPPVEDLLQVDAMFRQEQPTGPGEPDCFTPPMKFTHNGWSFRARQANSSLAHRMQRTEDWVEIDFEQGNILGRRTIITDGSPEMHGTRVVLGREGECMNRRNRTAA